MLLEVESNVVDSAGMGAKSAFNIKASAHAFRMLSSGLYSNKIRAVLREIGCNAADAHIMAGKKGVPFEVHLPSRLSNKFYIKDFGPGLDPDEIRDLYTTYFSSSKQQSNEVTGAFGLGSKSPFAYTDSFTITSAKNGVTTTYVAYLDEASAPAIRVVTSFPSDCAWTNGVQIGMAVKPQDVQTFITEAQFVYQFFAVLPTMVNSAPIQRRKYSVETPDFALPAAGNAIPTAVLVMGNVAYPLPMAELTRNLQNQYSLQSIVQKLNPEIRVPIGAVSVAASREHLEFTPQTQVVIQKIAEKLLGNFAEQYWEKVKDLKYDTFAGQRESQARLQALGVTLDVLQQLLRYHGKWDKEQQTWISLLLAYRTPFVRVPESLKTLKFEEHYLAHSRGRQVYRSIVLDLNEQPRDRVDATIADSFAVLIPDKKTKFMRERIRLALETGAYKFLYSVADDEAESLRIAKEWYDMPVVYSKVLPLPTTFVPPAQRPKVPRAPKVEPTYEYVDVVTGHTKQLQISQASARAKYFVEYTSSWGRRTYRFGNQGHGGLSRMVKGLAALHPHCSLIPDGFFVLTDRRIELLGLEKDLTWKSISSIGKVLLTPMIRDLVNREPDTSVGHVIGGGASEYSSPLKFLACHAKSNSKMWQALQKLLPSSPLLNATVLYAAGKSAKSTPISLDEYNNLVNEFSEWSSAMTPKPAPAEHSETAYPTFNAALSYDFPNRIAERDTQLTALIISQLIARDEQQLPTTIELLAA